MPNAKNQEMLANVKADLEATSAVWVVDYCGLTVKQIQELRRSVREAGAVMKVYKNTLMHIALADAELPTLDDMLQGSAVTTWLLLLRLSRSSPRATTFSRSRAASWTALPFLLPRWKLSLLCLPAKSSTLTSLLLSTVWLRVSRPPSLACRAVWLRSPRLWPTRRKLPSISSCGLRDAA